MNSAEKQNGVCAYLLAPSCYHQFQTHFRLSDVYYYYCSYSIFPVAARSQQLMQIAVYHLSHTFTARDKGHDKVHIYQLLFTIYDELCCFGVGYLQVSPAHSACRVNKASGNADTCLEPLPSRLITRLPPPFFHLL